MQSLYSHCTNSLRIKEMIPYKESNFSKGIRKEIVNNHKQLHCNTALHNVNIRNHLSNHYLQRFEVSCTVKFSSLPIMKQKNRVHLYHIDNRGSPANSDTQTSPSLQGTSRGYHRKKIPWSHSSHLSGCNQGSCSGTLQETEGHIPSRGNSWHKNIIRETYFIFKQK